MRGTDIGTRRHGRDIRSLDLRQLRQHIGIVPQETLLFGGSALADEPVDVLMKTSLGDIRLELFPDKAPVTVLDAATGEEIRTITNTNGTDEMLLCDGVLVTCVREQLSVASKPGPNAQPRRRLNPHEWTIAAPGPPRPGSIPIT